ncbi:alpha-2A adrenergic receptor [Trichonephila inaurata madagascariensis]|uniref:Alpha-2A adrenergic receptor n=1 Tax=Trichonephila inaurata madagascariensis TaxID=2747483 RepID=A0A8X6JTQ2_9ARAC|nr:alpha-2A adrenergic receptor [Trichonephila inaurata madagascariensis]
MEDLNSTSDAFLLTGNGSYSAFSIDYELFRQAINGTGDNRTDQNYSLAWQNRDRSVEDYSVEWEGAVYPSGYSHLGIILTSFFVTVIMILIVVGNMLVCIAIATEKALKTVQNWFIASLAVSDFLVGLIIMPFSLAKEVMGYWIFGRIWCEIHSALDVFLCTASINSLCLISLDRYWSVTHAVEYLRKRTPRRSIAMICGVWVLSAIISLPPLVGWKKPEKPSNYPECLLSDDVGYVLYSAFGSFYVPAFVMVFVYCRIFVAARSRARRHLKKKQKAQSAATELTNDPIKDKSTTTTTCTSFSNASPPDRSKDFEAFSPIPGLPKIPESNGTRSEVSASPVVFIEAPEIVIENSDEGLNKDDGLATPTIKVIPETEIQRVTFKDDIPSETNSLCKSSSSNIDKKENDVASSEKKHLFVKEPPPRRTSLLRAPKFLRSPFGSTLSLADLGGSEEDVSEMGDDSRQGKKKKKKKTKAPQEEAPKRQPTTEAERHKRRIAKAKERRATLILGLIMASFILAWLPFFVLYVLEALCKACDIGPTGFAIAFWLGYCNSALNPIIYTIFNRDFRKAFRKILFK